MGITKTIVHSDEYNIDGYFWLDEDDRYRVSVVSNGKEYIRVLDYKKDVPTQYISDYAWMTLEDLYEDILLEVVEEKGYEIESNENEELL